MIESPESAPRSDRSARASANALSGGGVRERQGNGPPFRHFKGQPREVCRLDLGGRKGGERAFLALRPKPVAGTLCHPPRTAPALFGFGPADAFGHQPRHARAGVEPRPAGQPAIDHHADIRNGQRGFGDGGRQNDTAARTGTQRLALFGEGQGAVERENIGMLDFTQAGGDPADFAFARQESQDTAGFLVQRPADQRCHIRVESCVPAPRTVEPAGPDRKTPAFRGYGFRPDQAGHGTGIERRRHDQKHHIRAQRSADFECQGQAEVSVQGAFVKFVEDHRADAVERRVGLDHPGQDAFGDHFDLCTRPGVPPDAVTDALAHLFAQCLGHARRSCPCRQTAGFEHDDLPRDNPGLRQRERNARGLTGARRGLKHGGAVAREDGDQLGQSMVDGQGHHGPDLSRGRFGRQFD